MTLSVVYPPCDRRSYTFQPPNSLQTNSLGAYYDCSGRLYSQPLGFAHPYYHINRYHPSAPVCDMAMPNPAEMEDFQRLSDQYQADLPGPLIGDKLPMSVLATEYAQADPTYVVKTTALAQTYSAYRNVKGDGQCGWRGAVFGYFETLLQLGDIQMVQQERVRLQSFEDTMRMAGIDYDIIVDMFDFTWDLFDDLQRAVGRQDKNDAVLLDNLNDEVRSNSIVYHFKMMTSAFMQLHGDQYEPFLEMPIADYRVSRIDPSNQEIDQIGLQALTDAVIAPANFAIEVLYLDRSMGDSATPHSFVAEPMGKPTIRLLYRPGHYDMIYKDERMVQVFLQSDMLIPHGMDMADTTEMSSDLQAFLFSGPPSCHQSQQGSQFYNIHHKSDSQSRGSYTYSSQSPQPCQLPLTQFRISPLQSLSPAPFDFSTIHPMQYSSSCPTEISTGSHPTTPLPQSSIGLPTSMSKKKPNEPQIRLSANCFNYRARHESVPLCTQSYGSAAILSPAHFRNQEFQPQIWRAEEEYTKF